MRLSHSRLRTYRRLQAILQRATGTDIRRRAPTLTDTLISTAKRKGLNMNEDKSTVYEMIDENNLGRKLFSGYHSECVDIIKFLHTKKRWPLDKLTIINSEGRHSSFVIKW